MERDSFIFYSSFYEALDGMDDKTQLEFFKALCTYGLRGEMPNVTGIVKAMLLLIKPQIDANNKRYNSGKKGGRPKIEEDNNKKPMVTEFETNGFEVENHWLQDEEPMVIEPETSGYETENDLETLKPMVTESETNGFKTENQWLQNKKPNDNVNDNDNVNEKEKSIKKEKRIRFSPPTLEEVKEYCIKRNNNVDPEIFVDFYASKGWKVGKETMKDWQAAVRTWEKRYDSTTSNGPPKRTLKPL